jgi:formylglycine-generating enzyme required for sulfatase activity
LRSLLAAVPEDPFAALVLADYLDEQEDARQRMQGELLRLVYTLTRSIGGGGRPQQEERMRSLLAQVVQPIGPYRRVVLDDQVSLDFAWVPPGVFLMGSPEDEEGRVLSDEEDRDPDCKPGEGPQHEVTLTRGFWMGTTPVTQLQFARVMGRNPSWDSTGGPDVEVENRQKPVQEVEWYDAGGFLRRLSKRLRKSGGRPRFRLPTEAEWEYACRAGTTTRFWSGNSEADLARVGWYGGNSFATIHPVGKAANPLGLCDMHGNVWQWCSDSYDEHYYARSPAKDPRCQRGEPERRIIRGGDAWDDAADCRSATRGTHAADCSHNDIGFRIVVDRL